MRIIFFTGKGGSGASTLAAATAAASAGRGRSTLAFGLAPGLATALGAAPAGPHPVAADLWAQEARPAESDAFRGWLRQLLDWRNMDVALADDLAALPGLRLVSGLLELEALAQQGEYDLIVVDGPPVGQCLDLLATLDASARWLDRLFPPRQPTVFEPFIRALTAYAPGGDDVYESGRDLLLRLARLRDVLTDPEAASFRLVLAAERSGLAATQQAVATLSLFAYPVDVAVANRLLPPDAAGGFFAGARSRQEEARRYLGDSLAPLPLLEAQLAPDPPAGPEALHALAASIYGDRDAAGALYRGPAHAFSQQDGHHVLSLALPFARQDELALEQEHGGLVVRLGERRRFIPLPSRSLETRSSTFDGQTLTVVFE